jgi:hypothetical protein
MMNDNSEGPQSMGSCQEPCAMNGQHCHRAPVEKVTAEHSGIENARIVQAQLGADKDVEELGCVGEVETHERVWGTQEDKED